jgi:hypothetical protein
MRLNPEQTAHRLMDTRFEEGPIKEVSRYKGNFSIVMEGGTGFGFKAEYLGPMKQPEVGDMIRVYGGWGDRTRGVDLRGEPVFYKTPDQLAAEHEEWKAHHKERQRKTFERNRRKLDRQFAALPPEFQRRISWFRAWNPDFRVENEGYEMMVCVDAVKIAEAMKTVAGVKRFGKASWKKQHELVPGLEEGHSGNSFGCAVMLARLYLENPILVVAWHGAMTPLTGCDDYGCAHPRPQDVLDAVAAQAAEQAA